MEFTTWAGICLGVLMLTHLCGLIILVATLMQLKHSARAIERLTYLAHDEVEKVGTATRNVADFTSVLNSSWVKFGVLGLGTLFALWPDNDKK